MNQNSTPTITTKPPEEIAAELQAELGQMISSKVNTQEAEKEEEDKLEEERIWKIRKLKAEVEKLEQDNEGRRTLRDSIFAVTVVWMFLNRYCLAYRGW